MLSAEIQTCELFNHFDVINTNVSYDKRKHSNNILHKTNYLLIIQAGQKMLLK